MSEKEYLIDSDHPLTPKQTSSIHKLMLMVEKEHPGKKLKATLTEGDVRISFSD